MRRFIQFLFCAHIISLAPCYAIADEFSQKTVVEMVAKGDAREALKYTETFANQGNVDAQMLMTWFYIRGIGTKPDPTKKIYWLERAAGQNDTRAHHELAWIYLDGRGVPHDISKAISWLETAYANGSTFTAPETLGKIYLSNVGVPRDVDLAQVWFGRCIVPKHHAPDSCMKPHVQRMLAYAINNKTDPSLVDPLSIIGNIGMVDGSVFEVLRFGTNAKPIEYQFDNMSLGPQAGLYEITSLRKDSMNIWHLQLADGAKNERYRPRLGIGSKLFYGQGSTKFIDFVTVDKRGRPFEKEVPFSDIQWITIDSDAYYFKQGWWGVITENNDND